MDVIDGLAAPAPGLRIGIDPAVLPVLLKENLTVDAGGDIVPALCDKLDVLGLTVVECEDAGLLVTTPATVPRSRGLTRLAERRYDLAIEAFASALKSSPDDLELLAFHKLAKQLHETSATVSERLLALERQAGFDLGLPPLAESPDWAWETGRNAEVSADAVSAYTEACQRMVSPVWGAYYRHLPRAGAGEFSPVATILAAEVAEFATVMWNLERRGVLAGTEADVYAYLAKSVDLDMIDAWLRARASKSAHLVTQGRRLAAQGRTEKAVELLEAAVGLAPANPEARAALALVQGTVRSDQRKLGQELASGEYHPPEAGVLQERIAELATELAEGGRLRELDVLRRMHGECVADAKFPEPEIVVRPPSEPGEATGVLGRATGLSGAEAVTVSVSMSQRIDTEAYHELLVDGRRIRRDPGQPVIQSFSWLDRHAKGVLPNYRIAVRCSHGYSCRDESLGAPLVLAAFSALYGLPVPHDVAVCGGVRAYGGTAPVRAIVSKVRTAARVGTRLMAVPVDNEGDLAQLSEAECRDTRIILASDTLDFVLCVFPEAKSPNGYRRSSDLFAGAWLCERTGLLPEALACYRLAQTLTPNDYSSARAVKRLSRRDMHKARVPAWVTGSETPVAAAPLPVRVPDAAEGTPEQAALTELASGLTVLAQDRFAREPESDVAAPLLELSLFINPGNRQSLLLKGKRLRKAAIEPPPPENVPWLDFAETAMNLASPRALAPSQRAREWAIACCLAVLEFVDSNNRQALAAVARRTDAGKLDLSAIVGRLSGLGTEPDAEPAPSGTDVGTLTPVKVRAVDLRKTSPKKGAVWQVVTRESG